MTDLALKREATMPTMNVAKSQALASNAASDSPSSSGASKKSPAAEQHLWDLYRLADNELVRNQLVEYYLPLIRPIALRICSRLPVQVDADDLISAGVFGLLDAIRTFDPDRGFKFSTYSGPRVYGAMIDELRAMDWAPRLARKRATSMDKTREKLSRTLGRRPTDEEVVEELDVSGDEYAKMVRDEAISNIVSLSRGSNNDSSNGREMFEFEIVEDVDQVDPVAAAQRQDLKQEITRNLSRTERLIVLLYYYEGMTFREIGVTVDLSESRVSQMHASVLARLKARFGLRESDLGRTD